MLKAMLRRIGFDDIPSSSNGSDALSKLRDRAYGLIISDWQRSLVSGLDLQCSKP